MKQKEFITAKQEQREAEKFSWNDLMSGDFLTSSLVVKQLPFIFFIVCLMMLYIANQHKYKKTHKEFGAVKKEVAVLRFKSMELRAELMKYSRQSQVLERIESKNLGLELSSEPPLVLEENNE
ncbi:FtsL-like putative cell division protein [Balneicella halophila]|nr:FtsL-like putative cell division protein [Balneicella halophila]